MKIVSSRADKYYAVTGIDKRFPKTPVSAMPVLCCRFINWQFLGEPRAEADRFAVIPTRRIGILRLYQLPGVFKYFGLEGEYGMGGIRVFGHSHQPKSTGFSVQPRAGNSILKVVPAPSSLSTVMQPL